MSHLAHAVKVKQAMLEKGVTSLELQETAIRSAYVRATIQYLFDYGYVFTGYTGEVESHVRARLNRWNEISPINGAFILESVRQCFLHLKKQAVDLCQFTPYPDNGQYGEYDALACPVYADLVKWLRNEMGSDHD